MEQALIQEHLCDSDQLFQEVILQLSERLSGVFQQTDRCGITETRVGSESENRKSRELISGSEADVLNWIAASIRARETENPGRVFMGIIKKKLFHHITQAQEDQARRALNRRRERHFEAYRERKPEDALAA